LCFDEFLLNAAFQEFCFGAVRTDFAMNQFSFFLDPQQRAADRRLVLGNFLCVQNRFVGNLDVIVERRRQVQTGVLILRRSAEEAAEQQRIRRGFRILHHFCNQIVLLDVSFFGHA
jgi:hypothetical protein